MPATGCVKSVVQQLSAGEGTDRHICIYFNEFSELIGEGISSSFMVVLSGVNECSND